MEGFLLGLSMGWFCLLSCGLYMAPFLFAEDADSRQNMISLMLFLGSRLLSYAAVGALTGLAGGMASAHYQGLFKGFSALSGLAIGLLLMAGGLVRSFPTLKPCRYISSAYRPALVAVLFGILSGLSICPPFVAAVAAVFTKGSALAGALYFFWFYMGTCLLFVPLFVIKVRRLNTDAVRSVARLMMLIMAVYFLFKGTCTLL